MRKKARKATKKRKEKSTEWSLGQPLDFPQRNNGNDIETRASEVVNEALGERLTPRRTRRKKK